MMDRMPFSWRPGALARATAAIAVGYGIRTALQGFAFVALGRLLGIEGFGAFSAVLAVVGSIGQLTSLGTQMVMLRTASRRPETFAKGWGATLVATGVAGPCLLAASTPLAIWLAPEGITLADVALLGFAEIVAAPLTTISISAYQAHEHMGRSSLHLITPALARVVAVAGLALSPLRGMNAITSWCAWYAAASVAAAAYALLRVRRELGAAVFDGASSRARDAVRDGWPFAAGAISLRVYADIDKAMLGRMDTLAATGGYAAAYRFSDLLLTPALALLTAAQPRLFRAGAAGAEPLIRYVRTLAFPAVAIGLLSAVALWLSAPLVPWVLGDSFVAAVEPLRWIAFLALVALPRLFAQHVLVGSEQHRAAIALLCFGAAANVGLNLLVIPVLGWKGAVVSTYTAEIVMFAGMALWLRRNPGQRPTTSEAPASDIQR